MEPLSEDEMIQRLIGAGIKVKPTTPDASAYWISYPDSDVSSNIYSNSRDWCFEVWERIPGPDVHDFVCAFPSRADALKAACEFYLGSPAIVDGWLVPLHRHPELTMEGIRHAIAQAINVSEEAFQGIAERRQARVDGNELLGRTRWEWALQYQFLKSDHATNPTISLQLRRDMQEAYIVHTDP